MNRDSRTRRSFPSLRVALVVVILLALAVGAAAIVVGGNRPAAGEAPPPRIAAPCPAPSASAEEPAVIAMPEPEPVEFEYGSGRSQATFYRISDGFHVGTGNERYARPALSLVKLYIAEYVFEHGTMAEQYDALQMLVDSNDQYAADLYEKYPGSVDAVAEEYGLYATRGAAHWGSSMTSTYDAVSFLSQLLERDATHPILVALSVPSEVAADGYEQDFGTAQLPGAVGTKWGWSDDRDLHSSVSFGDGWIAAAFMTGSAEDLNDYAQAQLGELAEEATD